MIGLTALHNSHIVRYRSPLGAVVCGTTVTLSLELCGEYAELCSVVLRLWDGTERFIEGERAPGCGAASSVLFRFKLNAPQTPCLMWYNFRIKTPDGLLYYGAADGALRSGAGVLTRDLPNDFRITVFESFSTPEWFRRAVVYQLFPDRFNRGELPAIDFAIAYHRNMGRRITVKKWEAEVDYLPYVGEEYYSPSDFYLGNFQGVIDKIPYLVSLSVTAVYMNPIFESPYNHRYSVSDYMRADPLLGAEKDFERMAKALRENGIRLILDGVFSHTGDDSVYFNKYGRYNSVGAYQGKHSPYYDWYDFNDPRGYKSWWGFATLPEVKELCPSYIEFIGRVVEKWMRLGASGWRLDVADELPDEFIRLLRKRLKAIDPEALLIGEVWEDASVKTGFGERRGYVNGDELDGVMNYPFANAVCDFLLYNTSAYLLQNVLTAQQEGYPKPFSYAQLGILGSHDTVRALTRLSNAPDRDALDVIKQHEFMPDTESAKLGRLRLIQAASLQFTMPFAPCIYYGDEAGMTGMADPFCRRPFPWANVDLELQNHYRKLGRLRQQLDVLQTGDASFFAYNADVFAVHRFICTANRQAKQASSVITVVNRSDSYSPVALCAEDFCRMVSKIKPLAPIYKEVLTGESIALDAARTLELRLPPHGVFILIGVD